MLISNIWETENKIVVLILTKQGIFYDSGESDTFFLKNFYKFLTSVMVICKPEILRALCRNSFIHIR